MRLAATILIATLLAPAWARAEGLQGLLKGRESAREHGFSKGISPTANRMLNERSNVGSRRFGLQTFERSMSGLGERRAIGLSTTNGFKTDTESPWGTRGNRYDMKTRERTTYADWNGKKGDIQNMGTRNKPRIANDFESPTIVNLMDATDSSSRYMEAMRQIPLDSVERLDFKRMPSNARTENAVGANEGAATPGAHATPANTTR